MKPLYVLDTHTWIWQLFNPKKLGENVYRILAAADRNEVHILIPAVVLAEISMEKGIYCPFFCVLSMYFW